MIANRSIDIFIDLLFEGKENEELREYVVQTTYINGVVFDDSTEEKEDEMNREYLALLKTMLPTMIEKLKETEDREFCAHVAKLYTILKTEN